MSREEALVPRHPALLHDERAVFSVRPSAPGTGNPRTHSLTYVRNMYLILDTAVLLQLYDCVNCIFSAPNVFPRAHWRQFRCGGSPDALDKDKHWSEEWVKSAESALVRRDIWIEIIKHDAHSSHGHERAYYSDYAHRSS